MPERNLYEQKQRIVKYKAYGKREKYNPQML